MQNVGKCFKFLCNNSDRTWVFNVLTFARSLGRCWKPRPSANVNAWKTIFDSYIHVLSISDRCILKHRDAVESIHAKMFDCFQYIASKRHPNFNKWLPDVINFLVYLRDFGIEFDKRSSKMNLEWPLIQKNPLLLEVFFSWNPRHVGPLVRNGVFLYVTIKDLSRL